MSDVPNDTIQEITINAASGQQIVIPYDSLKEHEYQHENHDNEWNALQKSKQFNTTGLEPELVAFIESVSDFPTCRDINLLKLRDHFIGGALAKKNRYHPKPQGLAPAVWRAFQTLLVPINLTKSAVNRFVNSLFSGTVARKIAKNTHGDELSQLSQSYEYQKSIFAVNEAAILYGTSFLVPILVQDDEDTPAELEFWLPDPVYSHLLVNPLNVRDNQALIEFSPCGTVMRFVTRAGMGIVQKDAAPIFTRFGSDGLGFLPVVTFYGHDRRQYGEQYGQSMVFEAPDTAIRCADIALNLSILQKLQSRSTLVIIAEDEGTPVDLSDAFGPQSNMRISGQGADAKYITPAAAFAETLTVLDFYVTQLCTTLGLPKDSLDNNVIEKNASAEAAKARGAALSTTVKRLIADAKANEAQLILVCTALLNWRDNGNQPVRLKALAKQIRTEVIYHASATPESIGELSQAMIALVAAGLITPEDGARFYNPDKSDTDIEAMAEAIRSRIGAKAARASVKANPTGEEPEQKASDSQTQEAA